ncbi:MAG: dephospho-CoA kinase [Candidatus Gastranaerophilales bacterium]|nr:dephospho-CoA kinase [Candidatus Gastranaerophilales bacterium]
MIKVAIVGNIASGKSQVEKILFYLCYKVTDTDKINHDILNFDIETINEIKETFVNDDILENNTISREKLGKIVFSNKEKKEKLESILHKKIFERVEDFFNQNQNEKIVFVSIPLLFETNQEKTFDKIIFISADKEIRLKRLIERNNYSKEYALIRINSQMDEEEKIKKSDFVIYNNSDLKDLEQSVKNVLNTLLNI